MESKHLLALPNRAVAPGPVGAKNEDGTGSSVACPSGYRRTDDAPLRPAAPFVRPVPATRALRGARTHRASAPSCRGAPVAVSRRPDIACVLMGFYCGHLQQAFASRHSRFFGFRRSAAVRASFNLLPSPPHLRSQGFWKREHHGAAPSQSFPSRSGRPRRHPRPGSGPTRRFRQPQPRSCRAT